MVLFKRQEEQPTAVAVTATVWHSMRFCIYEEGAESIPEVGNGRAPGSRTRAVFWTHMHGGARGRNISHAMALPITY